MNRLYFTSNLNVFTEAGVFLGFPTDVRNSIAKLLCENIISGKVPVSLFSTAVHVRIMLECVGQCLSLPLEHFNTIDQALQIYKSWFLDPKKQPSPIKEDEQFFYKEMFQQLSLIFTPRHNELAPAAEGIKGGGKEQLHALNEDIAIHTKFCKTALNIYRSVGVKYGRQFADDTWECLLKIVLGVADSMLSEPRGASLVIEQLVSELLNVIEYQSKLFVFNFTNYIYFIDII